MDNKRLEELKYNVIEYKNTRAFDICFEECDEIVALIDAAMQPPAEDVQRAIEFWEETLEEDKNIATPIYLKVLHLTITALRQMQPQEPCDRCGAWKALDLYRFCPKCGSKLKDGE